MSDGPVVVCDFGENKGKPHQPYQFSSSHSSIMCNYCGRALVLMGTVWAVQLTPEYYKAEQERLRTVLTNLRAALNALVAEHLGIGLSSQVCTVCDCRSASP